MPTREELMEEVKRKRLIEEVNRKRAPQDADQVQEEEDPYPIARGVSKAIIGGAGTVANTVDKYTGAPVRGVLGGQGFEYPLDPSRAPSGKDLAAKYLGLSEEDSIDTGLIVNPFSRETFKTSPAGVVGGIGETIMDPTTYLGALPVTKGAQLGMRGVGKVGQGIGDFAAERAVKAATGHNKRGLMEMAKVPHDNPGSVDRMLSNIRQRGQMLMAPDEAGKPVVGWGTNARTIADRAENKRQYFGDKLGRIDDTVDKLVPEGVFPPEIADEYINYAKTLSPVGEEKKIIPRVLEEAQGMRDLGVVDPITGIETMGPPRPLSMGEARDLKQKFPYKQISADPLETNASARNKMRGGIQNQMDKNVESAMNRAVSEEDRLLLGSMRDAGDRYGLYKDVGRLAAKEEGGQQSRRLLSPSSYGIGGAAMAGAVAAQQPGMIPVAVALAIGNQLALTRGPAFTARLSNAISKRMLDMSGAYNKYQMPFQRAAKAGNAAVVGLHHQLMQSDPEYRQMMAPISEESPDY